MNRCLLFSFPVLVSCGLDTGPCEGPHVGVWAGTTQPDQIVVTSECEFRYKGLNGCESVGTYAEPIEDQGAVRMTIDSSTGGLCLSPGDYTCQYVASESILTFDCGTGGFSYAR